MRDEGIDPVSVMLHGNRIEATDNGWKMWEVVGKSNENPCYQFETLFDPYAGFSRNEVDNIDLIVLFDGIPSKPLEIKLTVVPDSGTAKKKESEWAPEIVMRPVSSAYAMMGVAKSLLRTGNESIKDTVINAIKPAYNRISSWANESEIIRHSEFIQQALNDVLATVGSLQLPFLLQPIWRTKGQSLELCDQCFDVFVWSDVAVMGIPAKEYAVSKTMTRAFREMARHVRSLYDILQTGDYDYSGTYKGMSHGHQTDKSFAISGNKSIRYLKHDRLFTPVLQRSVLYELILNGEESELKPERRFDSAVQAHMINA